AITARRIVRIPNGVSPATPGMIILVGMERLELSRVAPHGPQPCAYTSSATSPIYQTARQLQTAATISRYFDCALTFAFFVAALFELLGFALRGWQHGARACERGQREHERGQHEEDGCADGDLGQQRLCAARAERGARNRTRK